MVRCFFDLLRKVRPQSARKAREFGFGRFGIAKFAAGRDHTGRGPRRSACRLRPLEDRHAGASKLQLPADGKASHARADDDDLHGRWISLAATRKPVITKHAIPKAYAITLNQDGNRQASA